MLAVLTENDILQTSFCKETSVGQKNVGFFLG